MGSNRILVVTETRLYEIPEGEEDKYRMLALMGPLERIPVSVSRTASVPDDDEDVGPF